MSVADSKYFSLVRVREQSPEAQDWASTDDNWDKISIILKQFENHAHTGTPSTNYPGYDPLDIPNPTLPTLTEGIVDGYLNPGTVVGVRLSYVDTNGLETQASPEQIISLSPATSRPLTPELVEIKSATQAVIDTETPGELAGGTYLYAITKSKGSGETELSDLLPVDIPYDDTYSVKISFDPITTYTELAKTGNTTISSEVVTSIDTSDISTGMIVTGSGIPADTKVLEVDTDNSTITLSEAATITASSVALTFNDGTESLNIYRSEGLDSAFTLVDKISTDSDTEYVDYGSYDAGLIGVQPPSASTFDAAKTVTISWADITHPSSASFLRVYVTQESHLWGDTHLLAELDLATYGATNIVYTGVEDLQAGWPKESNQTVSAPSKINLKTEATGAPLLTEDMDFNAFEAVNMVLGPSPTLPKAPGMLWYDSSTQSLILRGSSTDITVAGISGVYTHPAEESGGHIAANIPFKASSGVSAKTIFDRISDTNGNAKQVQPIINTEGTFDTLSNTATTLTNMAYSGFDGLMWCYAFTPMFNNQWLHVTWDGQFGAFGSTILTIDVAILRSVGSLVSSDKWARSFAFTPETGGGPIALSGEVWYQMPLTTTDYWPVLRWSTSSGAAVFAFNNRRRITAEAVF